MIKKTRHITGKTPDKWANCYCIHCNEQTYDSTKMIRKYSSTLCVKCLMDDMISGIYPLSTKSEWE